MIESHKTPNNLISEKSPYLLQHAHNPVNWYPWSEEAFKKAKKENKPIFLSIGYSTCHWCHVMEHESFEDKDVAKLMNETFISIKVDREERPDLDNIYMTVCQMMTGTGGWPLTVILTPDKKPFFSGTYFPKETRMGRIGLKDLTLRIDELWKYRQHELELSANEVVSYLKQIDTKSIGEALNEPDLEIAFEQLREKFDEQYGGFGSAPKFPTPHNLCFLLRYWKRTKNNVALEMVEKTLEAMYRGGMYDHIGYGFHRYSTDSKWFLPHFEKMLYDEALISIAYTEAFQATKNPLYKKAAREIFAYVLRDMTSKEGGFYSAEDADSEGEEGKFYVWTINEIKNILNKEQAELIINTYGLEKDGNYLEEATREKTGSNIFYLQNHLYEEDNIKNLEEAKKILFKEREKRVHPHKDDKILTDWNGLMIAALGKAAQIFQGPEYIKAAKNAIDFIFKNLISKDGKLLHRYRDGEASIAGFIDDYSFLIWGLIEVYEATFEINYLEKAISLTDELLKHFWDPKDGGFYFTSSDNDEKDLLIRKKEVYDGALPSGNSIMMLNLQRLGKIKANNIFLEKALKVNKAFSKNITMAPLAHTMFLNGVDFNIGPVFEITIVGDKEKEDTKLMLNAIRERFMPNKVLLFKPSNEKAQAQICRDYTCVESTDDVNKLIELLE